jgi:DNA modification methylase
VKVHSVHYTDILVPQNRWRKEFNSDALVELAGSIDAHGLIHPVVIRSDKDENNVLVAGERRIRAMHYLWDFFNKSVKCGDYEFDKEFVPCIFHSEMDPIEAMEVEFEENVRRTDFTWQENAAAVMRLAELKREMATSRGEAPPTIQQLHESITGNTTNADSTRDQLAVAAHLGDPEIQKATSTREAFKILKRKEQHAKNEALAVEVGRTLSGASHDLACGDAQELLAEIPDGTFDCICTDPPYGIDADQFSDSGGRVAGAHFYDDSWGNWNKLAKWFAGESFRITKPLGHCYVFADIDNFVLLKNYFSEAGWRVFRTPIIWANPTAMRAPWPEHGPQRKYQICLFAIKGDRPVTRLYGDIITVPSDNNLGHQAQKPVALYTDLLRRSVNPGDRVLDCFGGTGTILPAAHELKCKATYIERDAAAYGIAVKRLEELK